MEHSAALEAAVIGRADGTHRDALRAMVKQRVAGYKAPRWIDFVADLPRTSTGKIQRFRLRG